MKQKRKVFVVKQTENIIHIKIDKVAFNMLATKVFWLAICLITMTAILFWCFSINALQNLSVTPESPLYEVLEEAKVPFITFTICLEWFGMMIVFFYLRCGGRFKKNTNHKT